MDRVSTLDTVLDVCEHKHRRIVLATLADQQRSISIDDLTDAIIKHNQHLPPTETDDESYKQVYLSLYHAHLPKLDDAGFIQFESERKVVEPTAKVGRDGSHLSAILAMDSELLTA